MNTPQKRENKIFVNLASDMDEDRFFQASSSEKFEELSKPIGNVYFEVSSVNEAKELCLKFINSYNLGASRWTGGRIVDEKYNFLYRVSFNGRVWDSEDLFNANEIVI